MAIADDNAFLEEIWRDPHNDLARLGPYADWLDEQSDPRGEFIRVQCELVDADEETKKALITREKELIDRHGTEWKKPLQDFMDQLSMADKKLIGYDLNIGYDRGFIRPLIKMPLRHFTSHAEGLSKIAPLIQLHARDTAIQGHWVRSLAQSPHLQRVCSLQILGRPAKPDSLKDLVSSVNLKNLHEFALETSDANDAHARVIAEATGLESLKELSLYRNRIGYHGLKALLESKALPNLETLYLHNNSIGSVAPQLEQIHSTHLKHLKYLNLSKTLMTDRHVGLVLGFCHFPELQHLDLSQNTLRDAGAAVLADCKVLGSVQRLNLYVCDLGLGGAEALAASEYLHSLRRLDISSNKIGREGLQALLDSDRMPHLRALAVGTNDIEREGKTLRFSGRQAELEELNLHSNHITNDDIVALAECEHMKNLRRLVLRHTDVTSNGALAIVHSEHLKNLNCLWLDNTAGMDSARQELADWQARRGAEGNPINIQGVQLPSPSPQTLAEIEQIEKGRANNPSRSPGGQA